MKMRDYPTLHLSHKLIEMYAGLTLQGDWGKQVALVRLISLFRWSKTKWKLPCNLE